MSAGMTESLPCPHARSSWQHCPWYLGINNGISAGITTNATFTVTTGTLTSTAVDEPPPNREIPHYCCCGDNFCRKSELHRHRERCRTHKVHRAMRGNCGDVRGRR